MIYPASPADAAPVAALALLLWPDNTQEELAAEFSELTLQKDSAVFLLSLHGHLVGFAQCHLRHDYVEGTHTSPVGYLEGIFVLPEYRHQGYASQLLEHCECWAREQGCREFASDCPLENNSSLHFHLKAGFLEANRIICFTKVLE